MARQWYVIHTQTGYEDRVKTTLESKAKTSACNDLISQVLVPTKDGKGRACAMEIMIGTSAIRNLVREGKSHQITSAIQSGGKHGMITLDAALKNLLVSGTVSMEEAMLKAVDVEEFKRLCGSMA